MIPFSKSLGFRLLVISFILLALPLFVDSFILLQERYNHTLADARRILMEVTRLRELSIARLIPLHTSLVDFFTRYLKLEDFPSNASSSLNQELNLLAENGGLYGIVLIKKNADNTYEAVASSDPSYLHKNFTKFFEMQNFYNPNALDRGYASYFLLKDSKDPLFFIAHPIYSEKENRNVGVILLVADIAEKLKIFLRPIMHRYKINFALLLPSSIVIAASDPSLLLNYFLPLNPFFKKIFLEQEQLINGLPAYPLPRKQDDSRYPYFEFEWNNQTQIAYFEKLPNADYSILSYTSKNAIFQKPLLEFVDIYSVYGIILTVGGFVAALLTVLMAKPMQNLGLCMEQIQKGQLNLRYKNDRFGFEINDLGDIFNSMVDAVLEKKRVAEEERVAREIFARELRLGQELQRALLPQSMPYYPGVDLAAVYYPTIEVGGDFYDVFTKEESGSDKLMLMIADVSGKGVSGCLYSLSVRNMLRVFTKAYDDIAEVMHRTNQLFLQDTGESGTFVTALLAGYDYKTGLFSYYSCGHNPAILLKADGSVVFLENKGSALGAFETPKQEASTIKLMPHDAIIFYTDGVTEAHDINFQNFGEQRLSECVLAVRTMSAQEIATAIIAELNNFVGSAMQHDDITLLVMKVVPNA